MLSMLNKEIQQAKDKENVYLEPSQKRICKAQGERLRVLIAVTAKHLGCSRD